MKTKGRAGFAVVGLGNIAVGSVLPAFAHSKRAQLVARASRNKNKSSRMAQKFSAKASYGNGEFAVEIDAFADAIRGNHPIEPDGTQDHRDLAILKAIYDSARNQESMMIRYA